MYVINALFNEQEITYLNSAVGEFSRRAKHAHIQNFNEFLDDLFSFLNEIEDGYPISIYDYGNDLSGRDLAQELAEGSPVEIREKLNRIISDWDQKFKEITHPIKKHIIREDGKEDDEWWNYRLPNKLIGELKEDVELNKLE